MTKRKAPGDHHSIAGSFLVVAVRQARIQTLFYPSRPSRPLRFPNSFSFFLLYPEARPPAMTSKRASGEVSPRSASRPSGSIVFSADTN